MRTLTREDSFHTTEGAASVAAPETGDAGTRGNTRTLASSPCNAVCSTTLPRRFLTLRRRSISVDDLAKRLYTFQRILGCTVRSDICQCYGTLNPTWIDTKGPLRRAGKAVLLVGERGCRKRMRRRKLVAPGAGRCAISRCVSPRLLRGPRQSRP